MKTKAVWVYGVNDIRLEEFELPAVTEDEALIRVVSDSVCASTYKAIKQGPIHKRVPDDVEGNWQVRQKIIIQPTPKSPSGYDPSYTYPYIGSKVAIHGSAKKVCYNELELPLIAISDLEELGKHNELYRVLGEIVARNGGIWCAEAEDYLLAHAPRL